MAGIIGKSEIYVNFQCLIYIKVKLYKICITQLLLAGSLTGAMYLFIYCISVSLQPTQHIMILPTLTHHAEKNHVLILFYFATNSVGSLNKMANIPLPQE